MPPPSSNSLSTTDFARFCSSSSDWLEISPRRHPKLCSKGMPTMGLRLLQLSLPRAFPGWKAPVAPESPPGRDLKLSNSACCHSVSYPRFLQEYLQMDQQRPSHCRASSDEPELHPPYVWAPCHAVLPHSAPLEHFGHDDRGFARAIGRQPLAPPLAGRRRRRHTRLGESLAVLAHIIGSNIKRSRGRLI